MNRRLSDFRVIVSLFVLNVLVKKRFKLVQTWPCFSIINGSWKMKKYWFITLVLVAWIVLLDLLIPFGSFSLAGRATNAGRHISMVRDGMRYEQVSNNPKLSVPSISEPALQGNTVTALAGGGAHTCGLINGGVKCWGRNDNGQIGDGTSVNVRLTPVEVVGLSNGVSAIAARGHNCALLNSGAVKCWGENSFGQLGDGTSGIIRRTPVDVIGLNSGVTAIAVSGIHTCAVISNSSVKCWGSNFRGGLGDGTTTDRSTPVDVVGLSSGVTSIAVGGFHTCALSTSGGVKCWGSNTTGQLGDGTKIDRYTPVDVAGLNSGVIALTTGLGHTCALMNSGGIKCWGDNSSGELGDGTTTQRLTPVNVVGLSGDVTAIMTSIYHSCALTSSGGVKCWGRNDQGQLGDGTIIQHVTPVDVVGLNSSLSVVTVGGYHTCVLTSGGAVKCWGDNSSGQLGDGTITQRLTPVDVVGLGGETPTDTPTPTNIAPPTCVTFNVTLNGQQEVPPNTSTATGTAMVQVDTTTNTLNYAVSFSGLAGIETAAHIHGFAASGVNAPVLFGLPMGNPKVGYGTYRESEEANILAGLTYINIHSTAFSSGEIRGQIAGGIVGCSVPTATPPPTATSTATPVLPTSTPMNTPVSTATSTPSDNTSTSIAAGAFHSCAITSVGAVKCWGQNEYGQLGDGTTTSHSTPVDVIGLSSGVAAITAGRYHTCALTSSGGVKCWGYNAPGQLGDGTTIDHLTPVNVVGLSSGVTAVTTGDTNTCALTNGGVKCWGREFDEFGGSTDHSTPFNVSGLSNGVIAITTGAYHTCALISSGGVKCWGWNVLGQLGDGTTTSHSTPVDVVGLSSGVTAITAGSFGWPSPHTCALISGGGVKCWGRNDNGQLGDGTTIDRRTPVDVNSLNGGVSAINAGGPHTCILINGGSVKCWGNNSDGQLGDGTTTNHNTPVDVVGLSGGVSAISAGGSHTCTLTNSGAVKCWGRNDNGQLGDGTTTNRSSPVDVVGLGGGTPPAGLEPVIFIAGIAGSQLKLPDEYLWPVYLDGPKLKMTLKPDKQVKGIYTDDVVRTYDAFNIPVIPLFHNPVYGPIINRLSGAGYREYDTSYANQTGKDPNKRRLAGCDTSQTDAMLFVFPWDWRFGVTDAVSPTLSMSPNNVDLLAEYIGCIQKIHPDKKVNIVAHSMGGLLARNYILSHPSTHNVHRLISIVTPWLGAPKAVSMMLTGDFDPRIIKLDTTRTLLEYFPGAHQLLPSKQYYELLTSSDEYPLVALEGGLFNLEQHVNVAYSDFDKYLHSLYVSPAEGENYVSSVAFMGNNEKLYNDPKFADWNGDQSGVEYHVLTGKTTIDDTVYRVVKMANITWYGDLHFRYEKRLTKGDKTVPEKSQTRLGNGKNLNGQVKSLHQFVARKDESVKHEDMPSNIRVQDCILAILQKTSSCDSDEVTAAASTTQPVRYQRIWGVQSLQITDGISTTANLMTSTLSLNIFPNITLDYLGDDSVLLIIPDDKQYTVIAQAKNSLYIKSTFGTDANTLQYESFEPLIVVTGTIVALSTSQSNLANLKVDTDGDGVPETNSIPISSLDGDAANDSTPPTITAQYDQLAKVLTISVMDTGSGILKVLYSLDGVSYLPYTQAVKLDPVQIDVVYAISQDKAGNWSDIAQVPTAYPIYLPLIIQK